MEEFALPAFLEGESFIHSETGRTEKVIKFGALRHELESVKGPIDHGCIDSLGVFDCRSYEETNRKGSVEAPVARHPHNSS